MAVAIEKGTLIVLPAEQIADLLSNGQVKIDKEATLIGYDVSWTAEQITAAIAAAKAQ